MPHTKPATPGNRPSPRICASFTQKYRCWVESLAPPYSETEGMLLLLYQLSGADRAREEHLPAPTPLPKCPISDLWIVVQDSWAEAKKYQRRFARRENKRTQARIRAAQAMAATPEQADQARQELEKEAVDRRDEVAEMVRRHESLSANFYVVVRIAFGCKLLRSVRA